VRIPDLVVLRPGPQPDILVDPPLLVIEVLSPDDSYSDTQERAQDYLDMGVRALWIIDPKTRTGRMCSGTGWIAADRLEVAGTDLYVDLAAIFNGIGDRPDLVYTRLRLKFRPRKDPARLRILVTCFSVPRSATASSF